MTFLAIFLFISVLFGLASTLYVYLEDRSLPGAHLRTVFWMAACLWWWGLVIVVAAFVIERLPKDRDNK